MGHLSGTKAPLYKDHLSTKTTITWSFEWSLYRHTGFTVSFILQMACTVAYKDTHNVIMKAKEDPV